jgi:uncharacterized protein
MRPEIRRIILAVVALVVVICLLFVILSALFPPEDPRFVGIPTIQPYANDFAGALDVGYVEWLDEICYDIDYETSCEVAVLVVNSTLPNDINYYALRTFQKNGIGKEGKDNGILVLVAVQDKHWRIEVGYGLMGVLTGAEATNLGQTYITPYLNDTTYLGGGLVDLTTDIETIIVNEYTGDTSGTPAYPINGIPLELWQWILIIVVVVALTAVTRGRIFLWLFLIIGSMGKGGGRWGGGRSGGGGGRG